MGGNILLRLRINATALLIRDLAVVASSGCSRAVCDCGAGKLVLDVVVDAGLFNCNDTTSSD